MLIEVFFLINALVNLRMLTKLHIYFMNMDNTVGHFNNFILVEVCIKKANVTTERDKC
jgi:hypothetical protein